MSFSTLAPAPPSEDKRWKIISATMRRHGYKGSSLIEVLHSVQDCFGYLDNASLEFVAESLRLPLSRVLGVATFYHFFKLKPQGRHTCVICTGTACYIKGAPELIGALGERFGIGPEETTPDGHLSVLTARCVGSCGLAPVAVLDGDVVGTIGPAELLGKIEALEDHAIG
jgi:bidirectional [NiFe] hydrogenase diaphorase subunit